MGGECNYVLRVARPSMRLEFVPDDSWKSAAMMSWADADIARLLSDAERVLAETAHRLRLPVQVSYPSYFVPCYRLHKGLHILQVSMLEVVF
jgi:hypothetical protein